MVCKSLNHNPVAMQIIWFQSQDANSSEQACQIGSGMYICGEKPPTIKQDKGDVQGRLFLKKALPGMGRKANGSHEEFNQIYFQNQKGKGLLRTSEMNTYS